MDALFGVMLITYGIQQDISLWCKRIQTLGTMFHSHYLIPFLKDQLTRKVIREHCLDVPREPDDPQTDTLRNGKGRCEEQLNIEHYLNYVTVWKHGVLLQILHILVCTPASQENPVIYCSAGVSLSLCFIYKHCTAAQKEFFHTVNT